MNITCPRCFTSYAVPDQLLGTGRKVRCTSCRFEWQETPAPQAALAAFAPPAEVVATAEPDFVVPAAEPESAPPVTPKPAPARRGRSAEPSGASLSTMAAWSFFALATLACALVLLREPLGHKATWITDLYEAVGLPVEGPNDWFKFDGVSLERTEQDGKITLLVRGKVLNQSRKLREVPALRLYWLPKTGGTGPETILQARPAKIAVGEAARFSGELRGVEAALGGEVKVTFLDPQDKKSAQTSTSKTAFKPDMATAPVMTPTDSQKDHHAPAQAAPAPHSGH